MFCSQGCLMEYFQMYKDRILQAIGQQGRKTRKASEPTINEAWTKDPGYNLTMEQGYIEARERFYQTWISNHVGD